MGGLREHRGQEGGVPQWVLPASSRISAAVRSSDPQSTGKPAAGTQAPFLACAMMWKFPKAVPSSFAAFALPLDGVSLHL